MFVLKEAVSSNTAVFPMGIPSNVESIYWDQSASRTFGQVDAWSSGLGILGGHDPDRDNAIIKAMRFPKDGKTLAAELNRCTKLFWKPVQIIGGSFVCTKEEISPKKVMGKTIPGVMEHYLRVTAKTPTNSKEFVTIRCIWYEKV